jgi:hypothetical protein
MKAEGLLVFQPVSRTGRRFQVVPSSRLLDSVRRMSDDTIRLVLSSVRDGAFDAQALAPHRPGQPDIGYPQACARGFDRETRISLCTYSDPVFDLLRRNREEIELFTGCRLRIASWPHRTPTATGCTRPWPERGRFPISWRCPSHGWRSSWPSTSCWTWTHAWRPAPH